MNSKISARTVLLVGLQGLWRGAAGVVAFALPLSWLGVTVAGGWLGIVACGVLSAVLFEAGMRFNKRCLGIPSGSCPVSSRAKQFVVAQPFVNALVQMLLVASLSLVALSAWWLIFPGALILVATAVIFGLVEKIVIGAFSK